MSRPVSTSLPLSLCLVSPSLVQKMLGDALGAGSQGCTELARDAAAKAGRMRGRPQRTNTDFLPAQANSSSAWFSGFVEVSNCLYFCYIGVLVP